VSFGPAGTGGNVVSKLALLSFTLALAFSVPGGAAQDLLDFEASDCLFVPLPSTEDFNAPVLHVKWCGSSGAVSTVDQQIGNGSGETCGRYANQLGWGALHQNTLYNLAVLHAKDGQFHLATEEVAACNCHNPPIEKMIRDRSREVVCWLRTQ
jgi:hypothetical protein